MIVIPVIDLLAGHAVLARQGRRDDYRPVDSPLCRAGAALPLARSLCTGLGARHLYIADLDAIQGRGDHLDLIAAIRAALPAVELWVDAGLRDPEALTAWRSAIDARPVIGSESWSSTAAIPDADAILSIDMDGRGLRDPSAIVRDPRRRPRDLILMNLQRVGSAQGPDLDLLAAWRHEAPEASLYLAGGVRDAADLDAAAEAGAAGVLLASAIHDGRIGAAEMQRLS